MKKPNVVARSERDTIAGMQKVLNRLDALLVTNPTNVRYVTGFVGAAPEEREALALLLRDTTYLFVNPLYKEAARELSNPTNPTNKPIVYVEIPRENQFNSLNKFLKNGTRLGFEEEDLTVAEFQNLKRALKSVSLVPTKNRVETLRMIKREDELNNIRAAATITDQCFDFIVKKIKPGVSEKEIAWEIESFIWRRGAELAFSPIVAFGENTSKPHYNANFSRPGLARQGRALGKPDIVLLDFGARVNGYCSDMTRVVFVGKPKDEWLRAYETVRQAQQKAFDYLHLKGVKAHLSGGEADRIARRVIKQAGFPPYPHSLGHGVGLDIHEDPRLTILKDVTLKPGMVVTVEPAIYMEGSYGIRTEDLVVLNKDGIEVLSQSKKEMMIL